MSARLAGRKLAPKRALAIGVLLLAVAACGSSPAPADAPASSEQAAVNVSNSSAPGASVSGNDVSSLIPTQLVGEWRAVSEKCDPDSEEKPSKDIALSTLRLTADGHYRKQDWNGDASGSFTVSTIAGQPSAILDDAGNLMHYMLVDGHLENWGEGEAVYPCAQVFARVN
jgi:hypothetical protein